MLQGEPVLAFESNAVSINTLVDIAAARAAWDTGARRAHWLHAQARHGLRERAGVPDVVCWSSLLHDHAVVFGKEFARMTAEQMGEREGLNLAAAFLASCAAVTTVTEDGRLDPGQNSQVQKFELVDPEKTLLVDPQTRR